MSLQNLFKFGSDAVASFCKRHSTPLLIGAGTIGTVGATVWAVRNTIKGETKDVIENAKTEIQAAKDMEGNEGIPDYTAKEAKRDICKAIGRAAKEMVKIYIGPAILEVASISAFIGATRVQYRKASNLAVAYAGLDSAYRSYRERVAARLGEREEENIRYDIHEEEVDVVETDEDGNVRTRKEKVEVSNYDGYSSTARFLKIKEPWVGSSLTKQEMFINQAQNQAIDLLNMSETKFLTLNEVYGIYGVEESREGLILGWVPGDEVRVTAKRVRRPVIDRDTGKRIGDEPAVLLDFNAHDITGFLPVAKPPQLVRLA